MRAGTLGGALVAALLAASPARVAAQPPAGEGAGPPEAAAPPQPGAQAGEAAEASPDDDPEERRPAWDEPTPPRGAPGGPSASVDAAPAAGPVTTEQSAPAPIRYVLEDIDVRGNTTTADRVVRRFVPIRPGEILDVDDPAIEVIRWRLLGSGYFDEVRLSLRRGSRRGHVVLVIEVDERNTLLIQQLAMGFSEGVGGTRDRGADLLPYLGITVGETNLLGQGMEASLSLLASQRQQGIRGRFTDPLFLGSDHQLSATAFFSNGLEFFGDDPLVAVECPPLEPGEECPPEVEARNAVVFYKRYGLGFGTGGDLGRSAFYRLEWQGELLDVRIRPDAASEVRGTDVEPVDFDVAEGLSVVSAVAFGATYDRRNDPALPSQGALVHFGSDFGARFLGSDYMFLRLQVLGRLWAPLPGADHYLRFGGFAGVIFGDAPFFYKFFASDLSDLIPSRVLQMNIDRRAPPNLLGTAISEMRSEELAARVDVEYGHTLYQGTGGLKQIDAYLGMGLFVLADRRDVEVAIPGYAGLSRVPVDFTFDLGLRADTSVGVFQVGFSSLIGFVPVFSE